MAYDEMKLSFYGIFSLYPSAQPWRAAPPTRHSRFPARKGPFQPDSLNRLVKNLIFSQPVYGTGKLHVPVPWLKKTMAGFFNIL